MRLEPLLKTKSALLLLFISMVVCPFTLVSVQNNSLTTGAYTMSDGIELIRQDIAGYISNRDGGIKADPNTIVMGSGASEIIKVSFFALKAQFGCQNARPQISHSKTGLLLVPRSVVVCV